MKELIAAIREKSYSSSEYKAGVIPVDDAIALIMQHTEGKETAAKTLLSQLEGHTLVPNDVLALVIKDHTFLSEGICVCSYCGRDDYYPRKIAHKDTCPVFVIKAMLAAKEGADNDEH